ncbi:hypothetical protein AAFF_G00115040 [Aldrovandia affinis]|uniref:Uncharacterized protein n=1 Tax=Aldrovandia affinis TaxID=143900 RepID=A0AAD7RSZ2_9TELE|nr:hypothetical protein AAFF_G00115040 [Aldrovandia affinis]
MLYPLSHKEPQDDGEKWSEEERQPVKDHVVDLLDKVMHELQEIRMSTTPTAGSRNKPVTNYHPPPCRDPPPWRHHNEPVPGEHRQPPPRASSMPYPPYPGTQTQQPKPH